MRIELIKTTSRPIKKIFLINNNDFDAFFRVIKDISGEIDQICNLILPLDHLLTLESSKEFVRRADPDILFNLTERANEELENHFEVKTVKPTSDIWKIAKFSTPLKRFSTEPTLAGKFGASFPTSVFAVDKIDESQMSLFYAINFGLVVNEEDLNLGSSIFSDIKIHSAFNIADLSKSIFSHNEKFCHLTTYIGFGSGGGSSVFEKNYNPHGYFGNGRWVFVGSRLDLSLLCYFWNIRSVNLFSQIVWIPIELLADLKVALSYDVDLTFVVLNETDQQAIKEIFAGSSILIASEYYFSGAVTRWKCFEHTQSIAITGSPCYVQHPSEKSFSDIGMGGAHVIEVQGLTECTYPVRATFWDLYRPKEADWQLFQERFVRIGRRGLAAYNLNISFENSPIGIEFPLPDFDQAIRHLFLSKGIELKETPKTRLLDQLINLLGGLSEAAEICHQQIFDLIMSLTPTMRTEVAIKKLLGDSPANVLDASLEVVSKAVDSGAVEMPVAFSTVDELYSKVRSFNSKISKVNFFSILQNLYDRRIFLRGKYFDCPMCATKIWLPLERLSSGNYCPECSNVINIPVHKGEQAEKDHYRLNQLVVRSVDQGQVSTLLLLNILHKQSFRIFDFISNVEMLKDGVVISDADIIFRIGGKIGIAECKSGRNFSGEQVDSLIDIVLTLKLDFVMLSCLLSYDSPELKESIGYIESKKLDFPVLIFTREILFSENQIKIYRYFESSMTGKFQSGPILIRDATLKAMGK